MQSRDAEGYTETDDDAIREEFYSRLSDFGKNLAIALSSDKFLSDTDEETISRYKADFMKNSQNLFSRLSKIFGPKDYLILTT